MRMMMVMIMTMIIKRHLHLNQEGDDVYFECLIVSNPAATRLEWFHRVTFNIQIIMMAKTILVMAINVIKNFMMKTILVMTRFSLKHNGQQSLSSLSA